MLSIVKWGVLAALVVTGSLQAFIYLRIRKYWDKLPVVAAEITHSKIDRWTDSNGKFHYDADIKFSYRFRGKDLASDTPALRSVELFVPFNYNGSLVAKYPIGEVVNARVLPVEPYTAYLEVAPFSKLSVILTPLLILLWSAYIVGTSAFFLSAFE